MMSAAPLAFPFTPGDRHGSRPAVTGDSPGGLLRKIMKLHGKGALRLDRILFGLTDKLERQP